MGNTPIQFVNDDPNFWLTNAIADYEAIAGRTLGNADPERLVVSAFALRLAQTCTMINSAANQNLIAFATGVALEQLGMKFGIYRLPATAAVVSIQFAISGASGTVDIPMGTRVKTSDGLVMFATNIDTTFSGGTGTVSVDCTCLTIGAVGNGYTAGLVNNIVDPIAFVTAATNLDTTSGGSDQESDDALRTRIPLANSTFSVAGPSNAYEFFAKTASASIIDVSVLDATPVPGSVTICVVCENGTIPDSAVLDAVTAILSDKKVRPLNDTVVVQAAGQQTFSITANLTLGANNTGTEAAQVTTALNAFVNNWKAKVMGVSIPVDRIIGIIMAVPNVYSVDLGGMTDVVVTGDEFAYCTDVTVNVVAVVASP